MGREGGSPWHTEATRGPLSPPLRIVQPPHSPATRRWGRVPRCGGNGRPRDGSIGSGGGCGSGGGRDSGDERGGGCCGGVCGGCHGDGGGDCCGVGGESGRPAAEYVPKCVTGIPRREEERT